MKSLSIYRRAAQYYRPYAALVGLGVVLLVVTIGLNLLKPWPIKWLVDSVLTNPSAKEVVWHGFQLSVHQAVVGAAVAMVLIYLFSSLFNLSHSYLNTYVSLRALLLLRTQVYSYLHHLPLHFHDQRRSGDSTARVVYDSQGVQTFYNMGFTGVLNALVTLVAAFLVMIRMDAPLAVLSFSVAPFLCATIYFFSSKVREQSRVLHQEESDVVAKAAEGLTSIRVVHAFGREKQEVTEFKKEARDSVSANLQLTRTNIASNLIVGLIMALGTAAVLYLAARHVLAGRLKVGDIWIFLTYLGMLYSPLEQLIHTAWGLEGAAASMQRVFEILDAEDAVPETRNARRLPRVQGVIDFQNVQFSYSPGHPILRGISLKIQQGQTVALVGATGSGKTTLLSMVPRFYDPTSGTVRIDGTNVKEVSKRSLREQIAVVLQDTLLLSGTVSDNIAYGRAGASRREIRAAAVAAQAHDFIMALPEKYGTPVGERGVRLSGGQKQRIGIARAFLKNAPVVLLDEPTSALDLETEAEIMGTLGNLMRQQTTLIVTHRLTTIHNVDWIYVLENGRVVEEGTGPALLDRDGLYARLWRAGISKPEEMLVK